MTHAELITLIEGRPKFICFAADRALKPVGGQGYWQCEMIVLYDPGVANCASILRFNYLKATESDTVWFKDEVPDLG